MEGGGVKFRDEGFGVLERVATTLTAEAVYNAPKGYNEWEKNELPISLVPAVAIEM